jgi:hypothetical protein
MKKLLPIVAAAAGLLTACEDTKFSGQLNAYNTFNITEEYDVIDCNNRFDWWNCQSKSLSVNPGSHSADISLTQSGSTKQIVLKLDGDKNKVIKISLDKDVSVGDQFSIRASQIKQDFDIVGRIDTQVSRSQEMSAIETCSETHYERRCHIEGGNQGHLVVATQQPGYLVPGHPPGEGQPGPGHQPPPYIPPHEVCENVPVTLYGNQDVSYYNQTTVKTLSAQFLKNSSNLADFVGSRSNTDKIYTYRGLCRLNGYSRY